MESTLGFTSPGLAIDPAGGQRWRGPQDGGSHPRVILIPPTRPRCCWNPLKRPALVFDTGKLKIPFLTPNTQPEYPELVLECSFDPRDNQFLSGLRPSCQGLR